MLGNDGKFKQHRWITIKRGQDYFSSDFLCCWWLLFSSEKKKVDIDCDQLQMQKKPFYHGKEKMIYIIQKNL